MYKRARRPSRKGTTYCPPPLCADQGESSSDLCFNFASIFKAANEYTSGDLSTRIQFSEAVHILQNQMQCSILLCAWHLIRPKKDLRIFVPRASGFTNAGDLHTMLPTSRQDGDQLPALGLGLAEDPGRQLLGLKTEHKAGGARTSAEDISCQPPLLNPDVSEHVNTDDSAVVAKLVHFLQDQVSYQRLFACRGTDAQTFLDLLQDLLDLDSFSSRKLLILKALVRLSRESGLHPRCFVLPELHKVGNQVAAGGFGDLWKGLVCKQFSREAVIWRQLAHPNILPFFGLYYLDNRLCLVSPWMENGNIMKFLEINKPDTRVRLSLILDVALGLQYLHKEKIVHGDLKGLNILVTPSGKACIADFGVSSITHAMTLLFTTSTANGKVGQHAIKHWNYSKEDRTTLGRMFMLLLVSAMRILEIMSGTIPFPELPNDMAVMFAVIEGKQPLRPMSCTGTTVLDSLWELLNSCWEGKAEMRPTAPQIVEWMEGPSIQAKTMSSTDWDDRFTSRFRRSLQTTNRRLSLTRIEHIIFGKEAVEGRNFTT
ncbi:kinase-like domain-containing protein [Mycena leptocephala]|nr:kinase-like domain-containing protein [Mycena leptocephala]